MNGLDIIQRLPQEFAARLEADEYFSDVVIVVAEEGDIAAEMARKQAIITEKAGKVGAAVIVLPLVGNDEQSNIALGPMTLFPSFQTMENLQLNRGVNGTGKSARQLARRVRDVIKLGGMSGVVTDLRPAKPCIEPVDLGEELGALIKACNVNFMCLETPGDVPAYVLPVQMTADQEAWTLALSCATEGATIYLTRDGSYPSPQNTAAEIYGGEPLAVPDAGLEVRACAYKAGAIASWVSRTKFEART